MSSIDIYAHNDTFISRNSCCQNYSKSPCLFVGDGIRSCCSTDINIAFMQFNLDSIDKCSILENAMLYIYINCEYFSACNLTFHLDIYRVLSCYNSCRISWTTGPNIKCTKCGSTINRNSVNCYVGVDITPIVKEWLKNPCCNNGIALVGKCTKRVISIASSKSCNEPFLRLNFCSCPCENLYCCNNDCQSSCDNSISCFCQYSNKCSNCSNPSCSCNEYTSSSCEYTNPCSKGGRTFCSCPADTCQYSQCCSNKYDCCKSCSNSCSNINNCCNPSGDCYSKKETCYKPCINDCPCLPCNECPCPRPCACESIYPRIINPCCPTNVICCTTPAGTTCCYSCNQCPCCGYCICQPTNCNLAVTGTTIIEGINVVSKEETAHDLKAVIETSKSTEINIPKVQDSVVNINTKIEDPIKEDNILSENVNNSINLESKEDTTLDYIEENLEEKKVSSEKITEKIYLSDSSETNKENSVLPKKNYILEEINSTDKILLIDTTENLKEDKILSEKVNINKEQEKPEKKEELNKTDKVELTNTDKLKVTDNIKVKEPLDVLGITVDDISAEIISITGSSSKNETIHTIDDNPSINNKIKKDIITNEKVKDRSTESFNDLSSIAQFVDESNSLKLYNDSLIPLKNVFIYGENVKHVDGSTDILLSANHAYMVNWTISAISSNPDFTMGGRLILNGDKVIGSLALNSLNNSKEAYITTSASLVLNTTKEINILQLKYITLSNETDRIINVSLHIIEIK